MGARLETRAKQESDNTPEEFFTGIEPEEIPGGKRIALIGIKMRGSANYVLYAYTIKGSKQSRIGHEDFVGRNPLENYQAFQRHCQGLTSASAIPYDPERDQLFPKVFQEIADMHIARD